MPKKTRCYIYTRVSTAIQVDGYSLEAQRESLTKYANYQDMEIVKDAGNDTEKIKEHLDKIDYEQTREINFAEHM